MAPLEIGACTPRAKMVKMADIMSNTRTIVESKPRFAKLYLTESLTLLELLKEGGPLYLQAVELVRKTLLETGEKND